MSFFRKVARRFAPQGGLILPRSVTRQGSSNWPKCAICMQAVDAYGLETDTPTQVEIWARCNGQAVDPATGAPIESRVHPPLQSSMTVNKGPDWSPNRFSDIVSRLAFFAPDALSEGRDFYQDISGEGVRKKHTV